MRGEDGRARQAIGARVRRHVGALALACVAIATGVPAASSATVPPTCLTPVAADGFEPPCNPHLADSGWSGAHRASYAQASSPFPGPTAGDAVRYEHVAPVLGVPLFFAFTSPYADGGRAAWVSTVATPDGRYVYKVDAATGREIARYGALDDGEIAGLGGVSGAYNVLDRDNRLIVGRARSFEVYADADPRDRFSGIARLRRFVLPDSALCGPQDALVGITMLWDGRIAFASALGVVGTVPRDPARMTAENVVTTSLNGDRCEGASADDASLERVSNSIAADETGGIFVVTSKAMHALRWDGRRVTRTWRTAYATGAQSSIRIGDGSGSTPTLMGTGPRQDRFVVITDGQPLMHLDLYWRDEIPADWKGLPGKDRRLACSIPVRFGDPTATTSQSEQSVLVRGYSSVVVNNQLRNVDGLIGGLNGNARLLAAALAGGDPRNAPYGMERLDWDPVTRTCRSVWVNRDVSIPNGIPSLSTATGVVYGMGQRDGVWGLEGVDLATGASRLRVDATPRPDDNSAYAMTTVGPDGAIWTGTLAGYTVFRGPVKPAPPVACLDLTPPTSEVRVAVGRVPRTRLARTGGTVAGVARDRACGDVVRRGVTRAEVAVALRVRGGCRSLTARGTLSATRSCARRTWLRAALSDDRRRFTRRVRARLPRGRYVVASRVTDRRGYVEVAPRTRSVRVR